MKDLKHSGQMVDIAVNAWPRCVDTDSIRAMRWAVEEHVFFIDYTGEVSFR